MYRIFIKPIIDKSVAIIFLIVLLPVLFVCILALGFNYRGNPFFMQKRPGRNGSIFTIWKLKTMNDARDQYGYLLPDSERLTRLGMFIRRTSLDELPQLWNVLIGDMSLIGPRPLLIEYMTLYNDQQKRRHEVRPGITGWAQVNGRNAISWEQKFEYDVWYVDNCTFALDMKILWLTVLKVFKREGINQAGQATVENFNGNK